MDKSVQPHLGRTVWSHMLGNSSENTTDGATAADGGPAAMEALPWERTCLGWSTFHWSSGWHGSSTLPLAPSPLLLLVLHSCPWADRSCQHANYLTRKLSHSFLSGNPGYDTNCSTHSKVAHLDPLYCLDLSYYQISSVRESKKDTAGVQTQKPQGHLLYMLAKRKTN